jgi:AcrR family transcriptional regulator
MKQNIGTRTKPPAHAADDGEASTATRDAILRAAGEILDELGYEGLNTTAVAYRAGVSTATLYRLFQDKHAVLRALVLSLQTERFAAATSMYDSIGAAGDWRTPMAEAIRIAYRLRLQRPGGRSTRRALQTSPELWEWDRAQTKALAALLARAMRRRKPSIGKATAERVALVAVSASVALLDVACLDERRGKALLEEATAMREAYLSLYLD